MPQVPAISLPSGGAFGYPATTDPTQEMTTHVLAGAGGSSPNQVVTLDDETGSFPLSKPLGTTTILRGTFASMPAAGVAGRLYFTSDTFVLYRDSGAVWVAVGAGLNASGLVPTAQLGTGVASSTTFLRGDGTWGVATALLANISKLIIAGHSYNMIVQNVMGAGYNPNGFTVNGGSLVDRGQWPCMVQDILGIGADRKYYLISLQQTGATADYEVDVPVEEDCWVEAVSYFPNAAVATGASTASRQWTIAVPDFPGATTEHIIGIRTQTTGDLGAAALVQGIEAPLIDVCEVTPNVLGNTPAQAFRSSSKAGTDFTQFFAGSVVCPGGQAIQVRSTHLGATGRSDPGGIMAIRTGGRFRNYSVGGSQIVQSGVYRGGWATSMNPMWNPRAVLPQNNALPLNITTKFPSTQTTAGGTISTIASTVTVASTTDFPASGTFSMWTNGGAQTVTYTGGGGGGTTFTGCTIAAGSQTYNSGFQCCATSVAFEAIIFGSFGGTLIAPNGTVATLTSILAGNATTSNTAAVAPASGGDHGTVAVGQQAQLVSQANPFGYETPTGHALAILLSGINDCSSNTNFDIVGLREVYRAWAAFHCCSGFWSQNQLTGLMPKNIVTSNGTGTWTEKAQPAWGQFGGSWWSFTGSPNASSKLTISLGPGFTGGPVDLFFLAWAGTTDGGTASITVDGSTPPQGAVTICTTGACPSAASNILTGTVTSGGGTFAFGPFTSGGGFRDYVGMKMKGTPFSNGSIVTSSDGTNTGFATTPACGATAGATCTAAGCIPMVKRLTGISAGAHTIEITITSMFNTTGDAEFMFWGYGLEPTTALPNPTILCNVPQILGNYFGFDPNSNAQTLNTEIPKVIAGTATAVAGNSTEPALPSTVLADLDAAINKTAAYFSNDGLHPNTLGHAVIANTVATAIKNNFTLLQSMAR